MNCSLRFIQDFGCTWLSNIDRATLLAAIDLLDSDNLIPDLPKFIAENNFSEAIVSLLISQNNQAVYEQGFKNGRTVKADTNRYFNDSQFKPNPRKV